MIAHQYPGVNAPSGPAADFGENLKEKSAIVVVPEYRLPPIAPRQDMIKGPRKFNANTARHSLIFYSKTSAPSTVRKCRLTPSFLLFHPHIHTIVAGTGLDAAGRVVQVKSPGFLVPRPVLRKNFRQLFRQKLEALRRLPENAGLPALEPAVWTKDWGVHLQPFGDGAQAIKYLGTYVSRTAMADARILGVGDSTVTFTWKDRARGNARRTETISGIDFLQRYLRHVLPVGLRSIRRYGYCHPAAKDTRERVAFHTGCTLVVGPPEPVPPSPGFLCPCCGAPMIPLQKLPALWKSGRVPPPPIARAA
jgi:hypothetical protein